VGIVKKIKEKIADTIIEKGIKAEKAGRYDMYWEDAYTGSIIVVYDGRAPELAARNLYALLKEIGQEVIIRDAEEYKYGDDRRLYEKAKKTIIIGHHSLAKNELKKVEPLKYNIFGIKFGYAGNLCVLRASDSELKSDKKNRETFNAYYSDSMRNHTEFAKKYNLPMVTGVREHTRDTQYDLLFLDFALRGLSVFLGLGTDIKNTYLMK